MIRTLFYLTLIALLVAYVPDITRKSLKDTITSVYIIGQKLLKQTFPDASDKLKGILSEKTYPHDHEAIALLAQRKFMNNVKTEDKEETFEGSMHEQENPYENKEIQSFYEENRDKLVELMHMLEEPYNGKDK